MLTGNTLRHLGAMFASPDYNPAKDTGTIRIAATAVEREILLDPFLRNACAGATGLAVEVVRAGSTFETIQELQQGKLDLCFQPLVADGGDAIMQRKLTSFDDVVFFDPRYPLQEGDIAAFCTRSRARRTWSRCQFRD